MKKSFLLILFIKVCQHIYCFEIIVYIWNVYTPKNFLLYPNSKEGQHSMNETNNTRYEITHELRVRLKALAKENHYSQSFLAQKLHFNNIDQYKNILKTTGTQKYIKHATLEELSYLYRVSIDYLIGKTEYKDSNANGSKFRIPVDFSGGDKIKDNVTRFINSDSNYTFTKDLNFIINLPDDNRNALINALHSIVSLLETNYFYTNRKGLSNASVQMITDALRLNDTTYDDRLIQLANVCNIDPDTNPEKCLKAALQLLLMPKGFQRTEHNEAFKTILYLSASWKSFPSQLYRYFADFSELCSNYSFELSDECKNAIISIIESTT